MSAKIAELEKTQVALERTAHDKKQVEAALARLKVRERGLAVSSVDMRLDATAGSREATTGIREAR